MNQSLLNISTLLKNPHLRYPVLIVAGIEIAKIWLPEYREQLNSSQKVIMFYLVAAAANSAPTPTTSTETKS
jgi:hypothetical protein